MLFLWHYSGWVAGRAAGEIENKANSVQYELKLELSLAIVGGTVMVNKELLAGSVPVNKELLTGTVPVNKELLTGTVPVNKELLTGTVPFNKELLTGTARNNLLHNI